MPDQRAPVTYSLTMSLDGYVSDQDGSLDWSVPDEEAFTLATDEVRTLRAHLMGRRLYEAMLFWEDIDEAPGSPYSTAEFARLWRSVPKVVFSRTLTAVHGNARLATGTLAEEIAQLSAEPGEGAIGIGGASLAAHAAQSDLIDEYRLRVCPVLLGAGTPYFGHTAQIRQLELIESRVLQSTVQYLRYRVVR